ncbi:bifunctional glycosyltransferase/CDP-glycerol:glycerophosphate glycerophosphotransferase [Streptomyces xanthii]|uniref:Bifunctional glycosyltransferase family 2 protein/CDP-glycerol:glycerophosphate glycerophosphotransferase n=1 Tax=Streptomyces xanthii TaxID=2768069 RepID=A0A7H1BC33_9ACTN|nr:bifunctional glycosyltransferase family 2 protein/CDP-glycerol:glycerophosphate glycerophosphotransferase [Streptomyces xanthii]QNS06288.1 bifunctional glycosyltransferase family 2 protein/CDP-glycerol:glycerophosphate glycerophosphotransferase [Streptomyces xanthii]
MTRFTLVVPVYRVQSYLSECLDSVLGQDFTDFEVIAVDDCSPDGSGELLDAYAARDERVRAVHLPENVGLGLARNAGLERARGDYVLFLDSDDTLTPGSLRAVADRLAETADPDVLIYDYARTYWDGRRRRNQLAHLLRLPDPRTVLGLADRPELLDLLQIVWNKAYRRDFVERAGLRFPPGFYEDAPWTFGALISARGIALLDRVCVEYRQHRTGGNILGTVSRRHFDVFDQYERLFAFVDARPGLAGWRPALFRKMADHYLTILERPGRLPPDARAEFFHRAAADYAARRPAGFTPPPGSARYKYALLARGSYAALAGAGLAVKARASVRRRARGAARQSGRGAMSAYYRARLHAPLDENLAVFSAYWGRGVACNPAAIDAELARLAPHVRRVWAVRAEHAGRVPRGVEHVEVGSRAYWSALARATYLVNNVNFADAVVKRPGQIHLQTHHGTPLKTMGLDQRKYPASTRMDFDRLLARCDRWDYSLSSNRYSTAVWERVYPASYTSLETGYPRNDVLVNATAADVRRVRRELGLRDDATVLLHLPTHREYQSEFVPRLDLARVAAELGPDVTLLVRGHYFYAGSERLDGARASGRVLDVSAHPRVEELYLAADALITDYSSAMFDYALLDRPIVILADDWDVYSAVRGTYFDLTAEPPGAVVRSEDALVELLGSDGWHDGAATALRAAFRRRFCAFDDGRAAERVVRRVFLGERELLPFVPYEERRRAPSPAEVAALAERTGTA